MGENLGITAFYIFHGLIRLLCTVLCFALVCAAGIVPGFYYFPASSQPRVQIESAMFQQFMTTNVCCYVHAETENAWHQKQSSRGGSTPVGLSRAAPKSGSALQDSRPRDNDRFTFIYFITSPDTNGLGLHGCR